MLFVEFDVAFIEGIFKIKFEERTAAFRYLWIGLLHPSIRM